MIWTEKDRLQRVHDASRNDQRIRFARDRDRILYSSAFHRLSGVTQIVRAGEIDVFHTRQQHSIKVAQVGRRLAERCLSDYPQLGDDLGVHAEVVEAACLAHDLGHPPFGHKGEEALHKLVLEKGVEDGFEGNAQTFRIVTKLGVRFPDCAGLDLTRATLAACLKYPWFRNPKDKDKSKKWSAYKSEREDFEFAREFHLGEEKTAEASIMDWADDIAYSVHDLEDFHRCGALPWQKIFETEHQELLVGRAKDSWHNAPNGADGRLRAAMRRLFDLFTVAFETLLYNPYEGSREQRQQLRTLTSTLIGRYITAISLVETGNGVQINDEMLDEVNILKQITRDYIFTNPSLAAQQHGQYRIIRQLFEAIYNGCLKNSFPKFLPHRLRYLWDISHENNGEYEAARFTADCIASLTENEVTGLHGRLYGISSGSVLDPIVR